MNMRKVGIVSLCQNVPEINDMRSIPYTLCEYRTGRTRNGSRYSFAPKASFYIPPISSIRLRSVASWSRTPKSCSASTTATISHN